MIAPRRDPDVWLSSDEASLIPPRDLWVGPDDPINHYLRWPWEYLAYLTLLTGLRREGSVLELGCGHGRTARGLLAYLRSPGQYVGLDANRRRIADAQQRITTRWPNFTFIWADVHSAQDNPTGAPATAYEFPVATSSADVIYAASLFTHLLPEEAAQYLRQSRGVLRPDGRMLVSLFVLDYYRGPGTSISPVYQFDDLLPPHRDVAVRDVSRPDLAIAYGLAAFERLAGDAGLVVERVLPGLWSESPGFAVNEQDLIVLRPDDHVDPPAT